MMINAARLMGVLLCLLYLPPLARGQEASGKSGDAADLISFEVSQQRACASQKTSYAPSKDTSAAHANWNATSHDSYKQRPHNYSR